MIPKRLIDEIELWQREKKFGNLQINFCKGEIVTINRTESLKVSVLGNGVGDVKVTASQTV